jgi:RNA polymerase sigma-70 factor (ECF subfamily)
MNVYSPLAEKVSGVEKIAAVSDVSALIRRCNQGDARAWEEFYARYRPKIECALRRRNLDRRRDVEDLVQKVFLTLFKALQTYDPSKSLEAYILEITRRVSVSEFRERVAQKRGGDNPVNLGLNLHDCDEDGQRVTLASRENDPEGLLQKAQEAGLLRRALQRISESCRKLLRLRYEDELAYAEIAGVLGLKEPTLRVQVQRCLSSLSRSYAELTPEEAIAP